MGRPKQKNLCPIAKDHHPAVVLSSLLSHNVLYHKKNNLQKKMPKRAFFC